MQTADRQRQLCIQKISQWANTCGFRMSKSKTRCMHFCQQRKMHNDSFIKHEDTKVPVVEECKFLAVIFDKNLKFIHPHLKYTKTKSTRSQKLLRVVAYREWGADQQMLFKLYRSQICSRLGNAIFIKRSARRSYLKELDPIHQEGLQPVKGIFKTFQVDNLYA